MRKEGRTGVRGKGRKRGREGETPLPVSMYDLEFRRARELNHKHLLGSKENATE